MDILTISSTLSHSKMMTSPLYSKTYEERKAAVGTFS
jgi:hypothetical protein